MTDDMVTAEIEVTFTRTTEYNGTFEVEVPRNVAEDPDALYRWVEEKEDWSDVEDSAVWDNELDDVNLVEIISEDDDD